MALCKLSNDILKTNSCGYSLPEVKDIYLANYSDIQSSAVASVDGGCGESITAISLAADAKFYHIEPSKGSASFEDALVVEDNGTKYRTHTLTFSLSNKYDACMHMNLDNLALGRYFAVVKTAEGSYYALGRLTGLEADTATVSGGGDSNGIQVVLSANVTESIIPLTDAAVTTVVGA